MAILFVVFLSGCGVAISHYKIVENHFSNHDYQKADAVIEKEKENYGERNAVLFWMDKGMVLHLNEQFKASNEYLTKAEYKIEELFTKSITGEVGAMFTNDNTLPYEGEDSEKVMVNVIMALNYAMLKEWDDALVEARKVEHKLNMYNDKYDEKKNVYKEDAFARYLSGILYEAKGETNDALISYRLAYEGFKLYKSYYATPMPVQLIKDLLRLTEEMKFADEHREYREMYPNISWISQQELKNKAEIILISYHGLSPIKEDFFIDAKVPDGSKGWAHVRLAFPKFIPRPTAITYSELIVEEPRNPSNRNSFPTFLIEDVASIAKKNLENRIDRITTKAIARAAAKYLAGREVRRKAKEGGVVTGILGMIATDVYAVATEESDKRSWRTLPGQIHIAKILVDPGIYSFETRFISRSGSVLERQTFRASEIKAGEKKFIVSHSTY